MRQYFQRKLGIYVLTFFVAVTIDWMIPRFMPGDPVQTMLSRASLRPEAAQSMQAYLNSVFGLDMPAMISIDQIGLSSWKTSSMSSARASVRPVRRT